MPKIQDLHPCELDQERVKYSEDEQFICVFEFETGSTKLDLYLVYGSLSRKFFIFNRSAKKFSKPIPSFEAWSILWRWRACGEFYASAKSLGLDTRKNITKILSFCNKRWRRLIFEEKIVSVFVLGTISIFIVPGIISLVATYPLTSGILTLLFLLWGFVL